MPVSQDDFDRLEERVRDVERHLDRMAGMQAMLPYAAVIVTGLAGLGAILLR